MTVEVTTKVVCTWTADDVSIIQTTTEGGCWPNSRHIGLRIEDIDDIIMQLRIARCESQAYRYSWAQEFKREPRKLNSCDVDEISWDDRSMAND
jgi:hypothetical protein